MPDPVVVASFAELFQELSRYFTRPSFASFVLLAWGWVLSLRRHTITQIVMAAGAVGFKHISSFHRFFSRARWACDQFGISLMRMLIAQFIKDDEPIVILIDDTLGRHTGKKIVGASMHRDPLLSTRSKPVFHWGHLWVVLCISVRAFGKMWALPVLFRLYRSKDNCKTAKKPYQKITELALELLQLVGEALLDRKLIVVCDNAYTNGTLVKKLPANVTLIGRSRLDAVLFAPPEKRRPRQMGRPRVKGARLPSPTQQAAEPTAPWQELTVNVYGKWVSLRVLVIDALWYSVGGGRLLRLVVVRGFPDHENDDVFVSTDTTMTPTTLIERYAQRWSIEVTFHEVKGKLGFEEPQNRADRAVERTAPIALWLFSFVVLWYVQTGHNHKAAHLPIMPWYTNKSAPAFSDMLATLRRTSWMEILFTPEASVHDLQKRIQPILENAAAAT